MLLVPLLLYFPIFGFVNGQSQSNSVTLYNQIPLAHASPSKAMPTYTANMSAAYDNTIVPPPPPPGPGVQQPTFTLNLQQTNATVANLSIMQHGSFYGFSVEMSVATQLFGRNSTWISPATLNLLSHLVSRGGGLHIRLGGNTQDYAYMVDNIPNYHATGKEGTNTANPTQTPAVLYSIDFFYLAGNISALVPGVRWYLGIPFNDTNWRLQVAEYGEQILGKNLIGLQAGNEPDYYAAHQHRDQNYSMTDYANEFSQLVQAVQNDQRIPVKNNFIAPSLATGFWAPDDFWAQTGFMDKYKDQLVAVAMEHYPTNNCFALYNVGVWTNPADAIKMFLDHNQISDFLNLYTGTASLAVQHNLPFIMFETNSATCGGIPGVSGSFAATLWALDYGLLMAVKNFSHALMHFGGQNTFYNPITGTPPAFRKYNESTVGAVFYSMLAVAEIFGKSNVSQIVDTSNNGQFNPSYAIYDNGKLDKVVIINFVDDGSGAHDVTGTITVQGGKVPSQVWVKYLEGPSVSSHDNITWAGQTFGPPLNVDGRLRGALNITTVQCDTNANTCLVRVKAPSAAVVFLRDPSTFDQAYTGDKSPKTYGTTTKSGRYTVTIGPDDLKTAAGMGGAEWAKHRFGSTSLGSALKKDGAVGGVGVLGGRGKEVVGVIVGAVVAVVVGLGVVVG